MSVSLQEGAAVAVPAAAAVAASVALAPGQRLQDLQIQEVLAAAGTTIVYRASHTRLGRSVVLKEYLPSALARRLVGGLVQPLAASKVDTYNLGLQAFLQEARLLMEVQHPALVQVLRCWEQDGTAYQVMPLSPGASLQHWLAGLGTPPSESWLRQLLAPVMRALQALHEHGAHHGDVSLQSIWLQFDNRADSYGGQEPQPLLLGFSGACRAMAQASAGAAPDLHLGFGPIEQSDGAIVVRQGAWTDVYALCAVAYAAIAGRPPPPSLSRLERDDMVSARKVGRGRYSLPFLAAIDAGLKVRPHERLQSMAALRQLLGEPVALDTADVGRAPTALLTEAAERGTANPPNARALMETLRPAAWGALLLVLALTLTLALVGVVLAA